MSSREKYSSRAHRLSGFTLIELLVVVAIISLLSSVVLSSIQTAREQTRDTRRMQELITLVEAVQQYHLQNDSFPSGDGQGVRISEECTDDINFDDEMGDILSTLPSDPLDDIDACDGGALYNQQDSHFYGWDTSRCGEGYCFSINTLETGTDGSVGEQLLKKYERYGVERVDGKIQDQDCGGHANINDADFNVCLENDF